MKKFIYLKSASRKWFYSVLSDFHRQAKSWETYWEKTKDYWTRGKTALVKSFSKLACKFRDAKNWPALVGKHNWEKVFIFWSDKPAMLFIESLKNDFA